MHAGYPICYKKEKVSFFHIQRADNSAHARISGRALAAFCVTSELVT